MATALRCPGGNFQPRAAPIQRKTARASECCDGETRPKPWLNGTRDAHPHNSNSHPSKPLTAGRAFTVVSKCSQVCFRSTGQEGEADMIPIQEIDLHTQNNVLYRVHLIGPSTDFVFSSSRKNTFSVEILFYDSRTGQTSAWVIPFSEQFENPQSAFERGLGWVIGHANENGYTIDLVNNPCNCEFLDKQSQAQVFARFGIHPTHQVNGK